MQLPLHKGVNFIGRGIQEFCPYNERKLLQGVLEQSQVFIRIEEEALSIRDASSTNQSFLIRGASAHHIRTNIDREYDEFRSCLYHFGSKKERSKGLYPKDITEIPWQGLGISEKGQQWIKLDYGDVLWHFYGFLFVNKNHE